jgi:hypothetical protein
VVVPTPTPDTWYNLSPAQNSTSPARCIHGRYPLEFTAKVTVESVTAQPTWYWSTVVAPKKYTYGVEPKKYGAHPLTQELKFATNAPLRYKEFPITCIHPL